MAKGRVINKSISTSNKVNLGLRNPLDCLLYTWGLCHADDEGRIDGHATIFRATVAPALPGLTDSRVDLALTAMETEHLIIRYTVQEVMVVQFLDWDIHQTFKGFHRKPSHFPPEPKEVKSTQPGDNHPTLPVKETKLKESKDITTTQPEKQVDRVLTSIQELIEAYKTVKGFNDIPDWNKVNFGRFTKDAKNILLMVKGDVVIAVKGLKRIARRLNSKNLSWNLSTVVRMFPDWLIERSKEDYDDDCETDDD